MGFYVVTSHLFTLFGYFVINLVVFSRSRDMNGMSSPPLNPAFNHAIFGGGCRSSNRKPGTLADQA